MYLLFWLISALRKTKITTLKVDWYVFLTCFLKKYSFFGSVLPSMYIENKFSFGHGKKVMYYSIGGRGDKLSH